MQDESALARDPTLIEHLTAFRLEYTLTISGTRRWDPWPGRHSSNQSATATAVELARSSQACCPHPLLGVASFRQTEPRFKTKWPVREREIGEK